MSRSVNKKCQHCATLSIEEAIDLHGTTGDGCWNPNICHRRRSHYRHRDQVNRSRRNLRRSGVQQSIGEPPQSPIQIVAPLPPSSPSAVLVLYRQSADTPVHAVAVEIYQGDHRIGYVQPVHCMGMRGDKVTAYIRDILRSIHQQFGIARFEDVIKEIPVERCPIDPCPLKG